MVFSILSVRVGYKTGDRLLNVTTYYNNTITVTSAHYRTYLSVAIMVYTLGATEMIVVLIYVYTKIRKVKLIVVRFRFNVCFHNFKWRCIIYHAIYRLAIRKY